MKAKQRVELLKTLKARFENNMDRRKALDWTKVEARLQALVIYKLGNYGHD